MSSRKTRGFMQQVIVRNPNEPEFHQAVEEFAEVIIPFIEKKSYLESYRLPPLSFEKTI